MNHEIHERPMKPFTRVDGVFYFFDHPLHCHVDVDAANKLYAERHPPTLGSRLEFRYRYNPGDGIGQWTAIIDGAACLDDASTCEELERWLNEQLAKVAAPAPAKSGPITFEAADDMLRVFLDGQQVFSFACDEPKFVAKHMTRLCAGVQPAKMKPSAPRRFKGTWRGRKIVGFVAPNGAFIAMDGASKSVVGHLDDKDDLIEYEPLDPEPAPVVTQQHTDCATQLVHLVSCPTAVEQQRLIRDFAEIIARVFPHQ